MNSKTTAIFQSLKNNYNATCIKLSFESENLGNYEFNKVQKLINYADAKLLIKLGGCEALNDFIKAKEIDAHIILSPMIESKFALEKFLQTREKFNNGNTKFMVNIETIESCNNIEEILKAENLHLLDAVVIGRSDLCNSMKISDVDSTEVFNVVKTVFTKVKAKGIKCVLGGGITPKSSEFISNLGDLIDGFETRKVVFEDIAKVKPNLFDAIYQSIQFEVELYKEKQLYYSTRANEDNKKIASLLKVMKEEI